MARTRGTSLAVASRSPSAKVIEPTSVMRSSGRAAREASCEVVLTTSLRDEMSQIGECSAVGAVLTHLVKMMRWIGAEKGEQTRRSRPRSALLKAGCVRNARAADGLDRSFSNARGALRRALASAIRCSSCCCRAAKAARSSGRGGEGRRYDGRGKKL